MRKWILYLFVPDVLAVTAIVILGFLNIWVTSPITVLITILSFVVSLLHGGDVLGWRKVLLLAGLTFVVSLAFESVGVATGLIYGPYHYTDKLGPMFLGLVPYIIPLAWFMMMYPSYVIADRVMPIFGAAWQRKLAVAAVGAFVMTAWDLTMDPFMVEAEHWVWEVEGAYFGIPVQNYIGWLVTTLVTFLLFVWLGNPEPGVYKPQVPGWYFALPVYLYALNGLSSVLTDINLGLAGPALVGVFAMLPWVVWGLIAHPDLPG